MTQPPLERIATSLEAIRVWLEAFAPLPTLPQPPEKPLGPEAISYIDEEALWQIEQEETRAKARGLPDISSD